MLFSSFSFLFWFLPLVLLFYFLPFALSRKGQNPLPLSNAVLLAASLLFYAWGEPIYVFLMLATVLAHTLLALWVERATHPRVPMWMTVGLDVALLLTFKYLPLLGLPALPLPLGISFYTFQALSFVADVYMGKARAEKSPLTVALYISLFPQLIAGPIVRYTDVARDLKARHHSVYLFARGVRRFTAGLAKKVLLANAAGELFSHFGEGGSSSAVGAWLALLGFTFQIYFDFSGYSDMAIGLGNLFGFHFPENFDYPYVATSVTDFWRRWHKTLSSFFREYVYIPLGGNRKGVARTVLNLLTVWALTGLWHGASLNFLLWGIYYFLLLILEKFFLAPVLSRLPRGVARAFTMLAVMGGWILFFFDGSSPALTLPRLPLFLATLAGLGENGFARGADLYDLLRSLPLLAVCAVGATPLPRRFFGRIAKKEESLWRVALPLLALFASVVYLSDAAYNPFLYFRF